VNGLTILDKGIRADRGHSFTWIRGKSLRYMARAAMFVLSSAWEGLPTVLIEAMAVETPVVSTDCEWPYRDSEKW